MTFGGGDFILDDPDLWFVVINSQITTCEWRMSSSCPCQWEH